MGKSSTKTKTVAVTEEVKPGTAVAVQVAPGLPAYLAGKVGSGIVTAGIDSDDITLPRVKIAQDLTQEVQDEEVKKGSLFLNIGGTVMAEFGVKLPFVVIGTAKEYILWRPRKDNGGGILARARPVLVDGVRKYQWDKPNTVFDVKIDGKTPAKWKTGTYIEDDGLGDWGSEFGFDKDGQPVNKESGIAATAHHNYVVVFPTQGDMVAALSLSRSSAKRAKDLNALLKMVVGPVEARQFNVWTVAEKNDDNEYRNVKFAPAGFVDEAQFKRYATMASNFAGKNITVDQSDGGDELEKDDRA